MTALRWASLVGAVVVATIVALAVGAVSITPVDVLRALGLGDAADSTITTIVRDVRMPRVALALGTGAALAMSGATLQGLLRNPLAEPYLLGVSGGAAVGAVVVIAGGVQMAFGVTGGAFVGATLAVFLVLAVAHGASGGRRADPRVLLMAGVVVGAFANAAIMIALSGASAGSVRGALWWMMGSFAEATWRDVRWFSVLFALGSAALWYRARDVDVLALGDEAAAALGADVERSTRWLFIAASLLAAATVAAAGLIGFIGLVVPALVRSMGTARTRATLGASALAGAALMVLADAVARTVRAPTELPVGAVTAIIGVPFFLVQLVKTR